MAKKNFFLIFFIFFSKNRVFWAILRYNYIYRYYLKKRLSGRAAAMFYRVSSKEGPRGQSIDQDKPATGVASYAM
jgi:hypothetical protein